MHLLCENIRALRRERGMTQKQLAEQLNISDKTVSRWESGVQLPEASLLPEIARTLGVSVDSLYGIEPSEEEDESPSVIKKDDEKNLLHFKILMIVGILISLMGSLVYRYFGNAASLAPNLIQSEYYRTAKGATADILSFVGIIAVFIGIGVVIAAKVRFTMQNKPLMPDPAFATDARYSGAAVVVWAIIFLKTAPEILSFGFVVSRSVYGDICVALLTCVLLWYRAQLTKRGFITTKKVMVIALAVGIIGVAVSITGVVLRDHMAIATAMNTEGAAMSDAAFAELSARTARVSFMITAADWLILAAPVILYVDQLIKLRNVKS